MPITCLLSISDLSRSPHLPADAGHGRTSFTSQRPRHQRRSSRDIHPVNKRQTPTLACRRNLSQRGHTRSRKRQRRTADRVSRFTRPIPRQPFAAAASIFIALSNGLAAAMFYEINEAPSTLGKTLPFTICSLALTIGETLLACFNKREWRIQVERPDGGLANPWTDTRQ